jgi:hypothetical protein
VNKKTQITRPRRKAAYHVRHWSAYDQALVKRGAIPLWVSEDALKTWHDVGPTQRGAQFTYSDRAMETMLTVREVFPWTHRATEGFMRSLFTLLGTDLPVPDHTTLSRRGKTLSGRLPKRAQGPLQGGSTAVV